LKWKRLRSSAKNKILAWGLFFMSHSEKVMVDKEFFIKQILTIEENIQDLTELYFTSTPYQERVKDFYHLYITELEAFLSSISEKDKIPKVFVGTQVTLFYEDDNDVEDFTICFPEKSNPDNGYISFLSPVGRQLLLKNIGDKISLSIPNGSMPVMIKNIKFAG
jgi:transcription elongation factor GreA